MSSESAKATTEVLPTFPLDPGNGNALLYLVLLVCAILLVAIGVVIWLMVKTVYQGYKDDDKNQEQGGQVKQGKVASKSKSKGGVSGKRRTATKPESELQEEQQQEQKFFGPKDFSGSQNA